MPTDILLQAEKLSRHYGDRVALRDLDLTLVRGEVLGLLGPNGAGKTTTMRILSGTLPPTSGRVLIQGADMLAAPKRAKRDLGYLPETPPLYPDMRVSAYLAYCARLHGIAARDVEVAVQRVLVRCDLQAVERRVIGNLSKGYQQRVGIAQAIVHRPAVVILDEPTVGLDPLQIRGIRALIADLRSDHGVVLSSHILPEIQAVCDRVVILNQGMAVYSGDLRIPADPEGGVEVILSCERPPDPVYLRGLSGVLALESLSTVRVRLRLADAAAADVQRAVLDAGWGLAEWLPIQCSLEQLFVSLTHGEAA